MKGTSPHHRISHVAGKPTLTQNESKNMKMHNIIKLGKVTLAAAMTIGTLQAAEPLVKDGQKIAFLGDSITQAGARPGGYVNLVIRGLEANGVKATAIPAGISGHKSNQMLKRLDAHVLSKKPDWMTLSCGVNDVWHGAGGVPLDQYKINITKIVDFASAI